MFRALHPGNIGIRARMEDCLRLAKNAGFEGMDLAVSEAYDLAPDTFRGLRQASLVGVRLEDRGMGTSGELAG